MNNKFIKIVVAGSMQTHDVTLRMRHLHYAYVTIK